jgi:cell division protein FtsL
MEKEIHVVNRNTTFGCGTIILIIIIVMIFGNTGSKQVEQQIKTLNAKIDKLGSMVKKQSEKIDALTRKIDALTDHKKIQDF